MEIIFKIIDILFKRYRWLCWICGVIIVITSFYYPNTYKKAGNRFVSTVVNTTIQKGNEMTREIG